MSNTNTSNNKQAPENKKEEKKFGLTFYLGKLKKYEVVIVKYQYKKRKMLMIKMNILYKYNIIIL